MKKKELAEKIEKLEERIKKLELSDTFKNPPNTTHDSTWWDRIPTMTKKQETHCPRCGMTFEGSVLYSCPNLHCPLFIKTIC